MRVLRPQWRIVLLYLVVGALWIFFSDLLVAALVQDPVWILRLQNIKGWLFILITATLLFVMIRREGWPTRLWWKAMIKPFAVGCG